MVIVRHVPRYNGTIVKIKLDANSEKFCRALSKRFNRRCQRYREKNTNYCAFHGARSRKVTWHKQGYATRNKARIMAFYSKSLGPTLASVMAEMQARPMLERMRVDEEISLARAALGEQIKLVNVCMDPPLVPLPDGTMRTVQISDATRALAFTSMQNGISAVVTLVEKAARIESLSADKLSLSALDSLVIQITRVIGETLGDSPEMIQKAILIEQRIASEVRLPLDAMRGMGAKLSGDNDGGLSAPAVLNVIMPAQVSSVSQVRALPSVEHD